MRVPHLAPAVSSTIPSSFSSSASRTMALLSVWLAASTARMSRLCSLKLLSRSVSSVVPATAASAEWLDVRADPSLMRRRPGRSVEGASARRCSTAVAPHAANAS